MKKRILSLLLISFMTLSFMSSCGNKELKDKESEKKDSYGTLGSMFESFSSMEEYYDYFFSPYVYEKFNGEVQVMEFPQGEYEKYSESRGENYYHFVNNIQKGYKKIYNVKVADSWKPGSIILYPHGGIANRYACVYFCYRLEGKFVSIKYSYIPSYEYMKNTFGVDSVNTIYHQIYWNYGESFNLVMEKTFEKPFIKELQLKDRKVNAAISKYKKADKYRIDFIYDDLTVTVDGIKTKDLTDDFLKDFYLEEYIPPETSTAPAETTQPAA